jgi:signal transduction histidine kinase
MMPRGLKTKFFAVTWVSLQAVTLISLMLVYRGWPDISRMREARFEPAAVIRHYAGQTALDRATASWPAPARQKLEVFLRDHKTRETLLSVPLFDRGQSSFVILAINFGLSMGVSLLLTFYVTRPLEWLREGFLKIAEGDLDTRLGPRVGARRDEIADLADNFDQMAEKLQQLMTGRERIIHDLSHELRSPLARIGVAVGLIRKKGKVVTEILDRIEADSARLNAIVEDFLTLSRFENAFHRLDQFFDIGDLLRVVCNDARFEAEPRRVDVSLSLASGLSDAQHAPILTGAPELMRRALENIIRNAIRFSPPGKVVQVSAVVCDTSIVIEVRDEGFGVPPEILETMFEPFIKGADERSGIGLGLAIARRAVAAHGGWVTAANVQANGLSMRISLPISSTDDAGRMRIHPAEV